MVLETERFLNSKEIKEKYSFIGEDIKVLGIRIKDKIRLTVAIAFVDKYIESLEDYLDKKEKIKELIKNKFKNVELEVYINTADKPEEGLIYLTVTGTSAEHRDDGQVGRGNKFNGLITPFRSMSMEAVSGKNMFNHVGKIYNVLANEISKKIYEELNVRNQIYIVSKIEQEIYKPQLLLVEVFDKVEESKIKNIINEFLSSEYFEELMEKLIYEDILIA